MNLKQFSERLVAQSLVDLTGRQEFELTYDAKKQKLTTTLKLARYKLEEILSFFENNFAGTAVKVVYKNEKVKLTNGFDLAYVTFGSICKYLLEATGIRSMEDDLTAICKVTQWAEGNSSDKETIGRLLSYLRILLKSNNIDLLHNPPNAWIRLDIKYLEVLEVLEEDRSFILRADDFANDRQSEKALDPIAILTLNRTRYLVCKKKLDYEPTSSKLGYKATSSFHRWQYSPILTETERDRLHYTFCETIEPSLHWELSYSGKAVVSFLTCFLDTYVFTWLDTDLLNEDFLTRSSNYFRDVCDRTDFADPIDIRSFVAEVNRFEADYYDLENDSNTLIC